MLPFLLPTQGRLGDWEGASRSHSRSLAAAAASGSYEAALPVGCSYSGLRGGAGCLGQRLELHAAMARAGQGVAKVGGL